MSTGEVLVVFIGSSVYTFDVELIEDHIWLPHRRISTSLYRSWFIPLPSPCHLWDVKELRTVQFSITYHPRKFATKKSIHRNNDNPEDYRNRNDQICEVKESSGFTRRSPLWLSLYDQ